MLARRSYQVRSDGKIDLRKQKVEVAVIIDGKIHTRVEARRPGLTAVVGNADGSFDIEIVENGAQRFTDVRVVDEKSTNVLPWQREALGQ